MSEEINKLNICITSMKKDIEFIKESLEDNKQDHKELITKIDNWITASEKRFASKWTERIIIWGGITGGGIMIAKLLDLITI